MVELIRNKNDDESFVELAGRIINAEIVFARPDDVFVTKIDHWFDFKWRAFSNKSFGAVGVWREPLRMPPFIPDRIVEYSYFRRSGDEYQRQNSRRLHVYQHSMSNASRKIKRTSAVYVWLSGGTRENTQASLMVYKFGQDCQSSWYASFIRKRDWQIYKTENISKAEIKSLIKNSALVH